MLKAKNLQTLLEHEQSDEPSIRHILLGTADGTMIACSHFPERSEQLEELQVLGACAAGIYADFGQFASHFHSLLLMFEKGIVVVGALNGGALVLVVFGTLDAKPGLLQAKFETLVQNLSPALGDFV
eukprot:Lankesteria_metandrocarpae@DN3073_c0_g1_i2.p1